MFPVTMFIAFLQMDNLKEILEDLAMVLIMSMVVVKGYLLWAYMKNFLKIEKIGGILDDKLTTTNYGIDKMEKCKKQCAGIIRFYWYYYMSVVVLVGITLLLYRDKRLLYPAYFPFDWKSNDFLLFLAICYQYFGWGIAVVYNFSLDTYPAILMYMLNQYMLVFSEKVSLIGHDGDPDAHKYLRQAIDDHKLIKEYFSLLDELLSFGMFGMFICVTINMVSTILMTIYFSHNALQKVYYFMLFIGCGMQIILACYYGTHFTSYNDDLTTAIYSCNWMDGTPQFKKDMLIFMQNALQTKEFVAAGIIPITLASFGKIMRSTYSAFTILNHMSKSQ